MLTFVDIVRVCLAAVLLLNANSGAAQAWKIDYDGSRIGFVASYDSIQFEGLFKRWQGNISFDRTTPGSGAIQIDVDMASVNTRSNDRDVGIRSEEWFDVAQFAEATYRASAIRAAGADTFEVDATFSIKGQTHPLVSRFKWQEDEDGARLLGQVKVDRRTFAIGTGDWADDPVIGFGVTITYDLVLRPQ